MASISARSSDSNMRKSPETVCPTSMSRTAFVSAAPGMSSIMTPMEILSTSSAGTCRQTNQMKLPENITVDQRAIVPQKQIIFSPLDMRE